MGQNPKQSVLDPKRDDERRKEDDDAGTDRRLTLHSMSKEKLPSHTKNYCVSISTPSQNFTFCSKEVHYDVWNGLGQSVNSSVGKCWSQRVADSLWPSHPSLQLKKNESEFCFGHGMELVKRTLVSSPTKTEWMFTERIDMRKNIVSCLASRQFNEKTQVAAGCRDGVVAIYDIHSKNINKSVLLSPKIMAVEIMGPGPPKNILDCCFFGDVVISCGRWGYSFSNIEKNKKPTFRWSSDDNTPRCLQLCPLHEEQKEDSSQDECLLSTTSGEVFRMDLRSPHVLHKIRFDDEKKSKRLLLCTIGKDYVVVSGQSRHLTLLDLRKGNEVLFKSQEKMKGVVTCLKYSQAGFIWSGDDKNGVSLWKVKKQCIYGRLIEQKVTRVIRPESSDKRNERCTLSITPIQAVKFIQGPPGVHKSWMDTIRLKEIINPSWVHQREWKCDGGTDQILSSNEYFKKLLLLPFHIRIDDTPFYDGGLWGDYKEEYDILQQSVNPTQREVSKVDHKRDKNLKTFVDGVFESWAKKTKKVKKEAERQLFDAISMIHVEENASQYKHAIETLKSFIKFLAVEISTFFGGFNDEALLKKMKVETKKILTENEEKRKKKKKPEIGDDDDYCSSEETSQFILLGNLKGCGVCRHRSIMCKVICDGLRIPCEIVRGKYSTAYHHGNHAWNRIRIGTKNYIVDCSYSQGPEIPFFFEEQENDKNNLYSYAPHKIPTKEIKDQNIVEKIKNIWMTLQGGVGGSDINIVEFGETKMKIREMDLPEDPNHLIRLEREMGNHKMCNHPNILPIYCRFKGTEREESGKKSSEKKKYHCVATKLMNMNGRDFLSHTLWNLSDNEKKKRRQYTETLIFLLEVAKGMRYLKQLSMIHFDLTLENVLVKWCSVEEEIEEVRISNFEFSKIVPPDGFRRGKCLLPPDNDFRAPEINDGTKGTIGFPCDIYSFGKICQKFSELLEFDVTLSKIFEPCINEDPRKRPNWTPIIDTLKKMLKIRLKGERKTMNGHLKKRNISESNRIDVKQVGEETTSFLVSLDLRCYYTSDSDNDSDESPDQRKSK